MDEQWHLDLPPQALSSRCWGGSRTPQIQQSETQQKLMQILLKNIWLWPIAPAWRCASTVASWQKKDASKRDDNWDSLTVKVEMNFSKPHVCQQKTFYTFKMKSLICPLHFRWNLDVCFTSPRDKAVAACSTRSCVFSSFQRAAWSPWHKNEPAFRLLKSTVPVIISVVPCASQLIREDFMCPISSPNKSWCWRRIMEWCMFDHFNFRNAGMTQPPSATAALR